MAPVKEVDRLTASVKLFSGIETNPISVDLTDPHNQIRTVSSRGHNLDFLDGRPDPVSVTTYVERPTSKIAILVRTVHGNTISISMSLKDCVDDLKTEITKKTKVRKCDYWLECQGKPLTEEYTLEYYNLQNDSHVNMKGRVKGG